MAFFQKNWRFLALTLLASAILAVVLLNYFQAEPVPAIKASRRDTLATLTITGQIVAENAVTVSPPFQARITAIYAREGDLIARGQSLVALETSEAEAALSQAQAQTRQAQAALAFVKQGVRQEDRARLKSRIQEADWQRAQSAGALRSAQADADQARRFVDRMTPLAKDGAISANEYDAARARADAADQNVLSLKSAVQAATERYSQARDDYQKALAGPTGPEVAQARAAYDAAREQARVATAQLDRRVIRSPLDGVTLARVQEPGDMAMPGQAILRIADRATLEAQGYVEEADLSRIVVGQRCELVLDARPEESMACRVREVGHEVNPENGTVLIKADLPPKTVGGGALRLMPGMQADITLLTGSLRQAIILPATAVEKIQGRWRAYVLAQGRVQAREVQIQRISLENVQILSGLTPGEYVAQTASTSLLAKRRVTPQEASSAKTRPVTSSVPSSMPARP